MADEKTIERISLLDLEKMAKAGRKIKLPIIMIGGYAVEAYTGGYRYTKDIDFVSLKSGLNKLIPLLKQLGYQHKKTEYGIAGIKKINSGFVDLHISIDKVYDDSTKSSYPISSKTLKISKNRKVNGYYEENKDLNISVKVISLEELLLLKLMTRGRDKDITDIISLLMDKREEVNIKLFSECCDKANLRRHIAGRIQEFIINIRNGETRKIWEQLTGRRFAWKTEIDITRFLKKLL